MEAALESFAPLPWSDFRRRLFSADGKKRDGRKTAEEQGSPSFVLRIRCIGGGLASSSAVVATIHLARDNRTSVECSAKQEKFHAVATPAPIRLAS